MKVGIGADIVFRPAVQVREVAPAAAGDQDLPPNLDVMLQDGNATPALTRFSRAHQPCGAASDDQDIIGIQLLKITDTF